jgi:hypothetical protein
MHWIGLPVDGDLGQVFEYLVLLHPVGGVLLPEGRRSQLVDRPLWGLGAFLEVGRELWAREVHNTLPEGPRQAAHVGRAGGPVDGVDGGEPLHPPVPCLGGEGAQGAEGRQVQVPGVAPPGLRAELEQEAKWNLNLVAEAVVE